MRGAARIAVEMIRHLPSTAVGVLLLLASAWAGTARVREGWLVVEDFERFVWGGDWVTAQAARGADPRMKRVEEPVHGWMSRRARK